MLSTNINLLKAASWFQANRLTLNASKTKCMLFTPGNSSPPLPINPKIGSEKIARIGYRFDTKFFKLVGVCLDDSLNWKEHASKVRSKLAKTTYALARLKNLLPQDIKIQIYNSLFRCHIDYCLPIWGNITASDKKGIQNLQKKAIRYVCNSKYNSHTDPLFRQLKILKFNDMVKLQTGIFMFNIASEHHPHSVLNIFTKSDNFDRNMEFINSLVDSSTLANNFPSTGIRIWNSTPIEFRNWLKYLPNDIGNKNILAGPSTISASNCRKLNLSRINGFKKDFTTTAINKYRSSIKCTNSHCKDCNISPQN